MLVRIANREDPDQTAPRSSLIWFYAVCLGFFWLVNIYHNSQSYKLIYVVVKWTDSEILLLIALMRNQVSD